MRRLMLLFGFLLMTLAPTPALANHGMVNGPECGTYEWHGEEDYVKGRTDAMIYHVDHTVGCKHLIKSMLVAAGIGEAQGNSTQMNACQRDGKKDTVDHFNYYWHTDVNPDDVKVTCTRYSGPD